MVKPYMSSEDAVTGQNFVDQALAGTLTATDYYAFNELFTRLAEEGLFIHG